MRHPLAFTIVLVFSLCSLVAQPSLTFVNGSTTPGGTCGCLAANESRSAIWADDGLTLASLQAAVGTPLVWEFELYFGKFDAGSHGLAFLLQQESNKAIGGSRHALGYGGSVSSRIQPSVAIEMDTKYNAWHDPAPSNVDHMAAYFNGQHTGAPVAGPTLLPNIEDDAYHSFVVTWTYAPTDPANSTLQGVLDNNYVITVNFDPATLFNGTDPLYFGFTSTTSANAFNEHKVSFAALLDPSACSTVASAFPVELVGFDANRFKEFVRLDWETASELNNDYFEVHRSVDGQDWTKLTEVKGAGTTEIPQHYKFDDYQASMGKNFYRLRQVDFNGSATLSDIVEVNLDFATQDLLMLYPNPATEQITVQFRNAKDEKVYDIKVLDVHGRIIYRQSKPDADQLLEGWAIPVNEWSAGMYFLEIGTQSRTYSQQFVVK